MTLTSLHRFPFGAPVRPVTQTDRTPKRAFVLGVYASAVHARWLAPDGQQKVAALAVASEPEIFWRGQGADAIVASIPIPEEMGTLKAPGDNLNGPSGKALDFHYLVPLQLTRSDVWLCDLLPETRRNAGQASAIAAHYQPYVEKGIAPPTNIPMRPGPGFVTDERAEQIEGEIAESQAELLITLGDEPIVEFIRRYTGATALAQQATYGRPEPIMINGVLLEWLALVHPRQAAGLGRHSPEWRERHQQWEAARTRQNAV